MAEPRQDIPRLFLPGEYQLVIISPGKRKISSAELEYLRLRAEGFSSRQLDRKFGIDTAQTKAESNEVLRTRGSSQPIAACFDRRFLTLDENAIKANETLIGTNPYGLTELEIRALRMTLLDINYREPGHTSSVKEAIGRARSKMGTERDSLPFGPALLYGYITQRDVTELARRDMFTPRLDYSHIQSLRFMALGVGPEERAAALTTTSKDARDIVSDVNVILRTNGIVQSILVALKKGILNSNELAQQLTAGKEYTVEEFPGSLHEKEREILDLVLKSNGRYSTNEEIGLKLNSTRYAVNKRFSDVSCRLGLKKIPALVVFYEARRREKRNQRVTSDRIRRQATKEKAVQAAREQEAFRKICELTSRRRVVVDQVQSQHKNTEVALST